VPKLSGSDASALANLVEHPKSLKALEKLRGDARRIGDAIVNNGHQDPKVKSAAEGIRYWANQRKVKNLKKKM